jgi:DnaK suppressor protein
VNATQVAEFRELLAFERDRVALNLAVMREDGQRTIEDELGVSGAVGADTASLTFERELGTGLAEGAEQTLAQIDHALERLDEGTYGVCERCGADINVDRLLARPAATLCIHDQRLADRA